MHVTAGSKLLLDGPFAQALVLISAGRVRHAGENVAELEPGHLFGELAPRHGAARRPYATATVTAITDLTLVMFSRRQVKLLSENAPEVLASLLGTSFIAPRQPIAPQLKLVRSA